MPMRACPTPRRIFIAAVVSLVAAAAVPSIVRAQTVEAEPRLVDRIIAIVDEEMILQSDLDREIELYQLEQQYAGEDASPPDEAMRQEILNRLVESKLIIAAAKAADIQVEPEVIDRSVDEKVADLTRHFGSREALEQELARNGMTIDDYRARLANQMTDQHYLRAVISRFIRPNIEILENEITDYYAAHQAEMPATPDSVTLGSILIPIQPAEDVRREVQRKVSVAFQALQAGQPFADVARAHSEGPNAARGGAMGVLQRGSVADPQLDGTIFSLEEGRYSQPIVSQQGVHIVHIDAIRPEGRAVSQIFFPLRITREDIETAQAAADAARARIVGGEPFSMVAAEVSADPVSAREGGHLGTFRLEELSPQFQEALADLGAGDLSETILTPAGIYLFLVKERVVGRTLEFDEVKDDIRRAIENEKLEAELTKYVQGLRNRFFIDLKS